MKKITLRKKVGLAFDLGTSGFRAQSINLETGKTTGTVITLSNPLPGLNLMDQINSVLTVGYQKGRDLMIKTIVLMIKEMRIPFSKIKSIAVSGNSFQLSLFQNIEIRDLAYVGENKRKELKIKPLTRDGGIKKRLIAELPGKIDYIVPPCIAGLVGADGLAMMTETDFLEKNFALVIDFGTNAEMAFKNKNKIYFASAAAGPAIEGQCLKSGRVASPGCIVDLTYFKGKFFPKVIGKEMIVKSNLTPRWVTGTGAIALLDVGIKNGLIKPPKILTKNRRIDLTKNISINEQELKKLGIAIAAIRAGFLTLINQERFGKQLESIYMAGALGYFLDPRKALSLGLIPRCPKLIKQVGNTSLQLSKKLIREPKYLKKLQALSKRIKTGYVSFADSQNFKKLFILELSKWTEGLPEIKYFELLKKLGLFIPSINQGPRFTKTMFETAEQNGVKIINNLRRIYE
jgi:methylamine methyltransferase corrinoid protein reductive activase